MIAVRRAGVWMVVAAFLLSASPVLAGGKLSKEQEIACEAVLCLSSGQRPDECDDSLKKYFKIKAKKPWKTLKKRKKFLKKCPSGNYDGKDGHLDALAEGGGNCDIPTLVAELNTNEPPYTLAIPAYCQSLVSHEYTTGHELPIRSEVCLTAHLGELGGRPVPEYDFSQTTDGYSDHPLINQVDVEIYDISARLQQESYQDPICVTRWHDPVGPVPEAELNALLVQEVRRVDAQFMARRSEAIY